MSFVKVGNTFFNQKSDGSLLPVVDPETNKALKTGSLQYTSRANTDKLTFASGASLGIQSGSGQTIGGINLTPEQIARVQKNNPALAGKIGLNLVPPTQNSAPAASAPPSSAPPSSSSPVSAGMAGENQDITAMLQNVLKSVLEPAAGAENLADLESRRQALLRKQLLSSPYSEEGERVLTASQKLSLMQTRGQQFEPELAALEGEISKIRDNNSSAIEKLQAVSLVLDIQEKMSPTSVDNKEAFGQAATLRKEFITASGEFVSIRDAYNRIVSSAANPSPAGDLALIFNYMKMLDPGSTVREGEFANAENSASVPERVRAWYNKIMTGERLTEVQRADFISKSKEIYDATDRQHESLVSEYIKLANNFGLDPNNIILDLDIYDEISREEGGSSTTNFKDGATQQIQNDDGSTSTYKREGGKWILQSSDGKSTGQVEATSESLAEAIKSHESGGRQVAGESGEYGMYQFLPATWTKISTEFNKAMTGDNAPLAMTAENEDTVAKWKIASLLAKGYTPYEVALIWNTSLGGTEKPLEKKGVNSSGVNYDSVAYANKIISKLG